VVAGGVGTGDDSEPADGCREVPDVGRVSGGESGVWCDSLS